MSDDVDRRVRLAAFNFLDQQTQLRGDTLPRDLLAAGFTFEGQRVPLLGPQGIFKPALLTLPLSITTVPPVEGHPRPDDDEMAADGLLRYRYRCVDAAHQKLGIYPVRSATSGFTFAARRAGTRHATAATTTMTIGTRTNVTGSCGLMP